MIAAENLAKRYGAVDALRGISFSMQEGEIVGLLGPNGAGKTTAIKILTGFLQPDSGHVTIDGIDVVQNPRAVQRILGYLPENTPLYLDLSVQNYLRMMAELRGIASSEQDQYISDAVYATNLTEQLTRPIGELSKGYRQRVGLAQAILHKPKLLILDEPTIGLDPTQIVGIRRLIQHLAQHSTILFSTHILSEVEAVCDRAIILLNGMIKADAKLSELASTADVMLVMQRDHAGVPETLLTLDGISTINSTHSSDGYPAFHVVGEADADLAPTIFELAHTNHWPVREIRRDSQTLESVFNNLVTSST